MKTCGEEPMNYGGSEKKKRKTGKKNNHHRRFRVSTSIFWESVSFSGLCNSFRVFGGLRFRNNLEYFELRRNYDIRELRPGSDAALFLT